MKSAIRNTSRRAFLKSSAVLAGGLVIGFWLPERQRLAHAQGAPKPPVNPNAFLRIAKDGTVTVMVKNLEFGQGVTTALPMLVAEELECDWSKVRSELAPAAPEYVHTGFGMQMTGGSMSVGDSWKQLRTVGAQARTMLVAAAAQQWKVKPEACRAEKGFVLGPGGKKASFGSLADAAAKLPVPGKVELKSPKQFRLIGKPTRRIDSAEKVDAKTVFGMDMKRPNLHTALVAHAPAFGAKVASFDAQKVKGIAGVTHVVQTSNGVAVVAKSFWAAKKGRDALDIRWDLPAGTALSSEGLRKLYGELAAQPGPMARKAADPAAIKAAAKTVVAEYEVPFLAHAPMEPLNCTVEFRGDAAEIWCGSQFQTVDQAAAAKTLGLAPEQGEAQHDARRRRLRPAREPGVRLRDRGVRDRPRREGAREGGVDARGRHPRRLLPPDVRAPRGGGPRREGRHRRAGTTPSSASRSSPAPPSSPSW